MSTATRSQPIMLTRAPGTTPIAKVQQRNDRPKPGDKNADNPAAMVLTYLRLHWLAILFCGSLLGACLAYAAWTLIPEKYESYSLLQVASSPTIIGAKGDGTQNGTQFSTYLKTRKQLLTSDYLLSSALQDETYRISQTPTIEAEENPIRFLKENLEVSITEGSEIMRISMIGKHPDDIRRIVNAVKDAFYREVVEKEKALKNETRNQTQKQKVNLEEMMRQKPGFGPIDNTPIANSKNNAPATLPELPAIGDSQVKQASLNVPAAPIESAILDSPAFQKIRVQSLMEKINRLSGEIEQAPLEMERFKQRIALLEEELEKGPEPTPGLLEALEHDPDVMVKKQEAQFLRRDYEIKSSRVPNSNSMSARSWLRDAEVAEAEVEALKQRKALEFESARQLRGENTIANQLAVGKTALSDLETQLTYNQKLLEDAKRELSKIPAEQTAIEKEGPLVDPQKTDLLVHDSTYGQLTAQLIALDLELQSPDRVQVLQDASVPSQLDPKKRYMMTGIAGLLGLGLIALLFVGNEMRIRKLSSLTELRNLGPTSIVGVIPWQADGSASRDPLKRADVHESIDKLRSYVAQSWLNRGVATIAVTSPHADEGKAFTSFSLASSLNQAGYRTLLIDFDPRTPTLHRYANVANDQGVCELLRGEADPRGSVMLLPSGLHFLPAGKWSDEARQAAVGGRIEALLASLRGPFDCIVLHANSLLTMAESVEIARLSEVVLLCSLYRETRVQLLKRATERLGTMEVPYTGIVYLGATSQEALC